MATLKWAGHWKKDPGTTTRIVLLRQPLSEDLGVLDAADPGKAHGTAHRRSPLEHIAALDEVREQPKVGFEDGAGPRRRSSPTHQPKRVLREGDAHCRDGPALDHEQERPSVQEPRQGVIGVTQVGVMTAGRRKE